jgi:hypothetical protein
MKHTAIRILSLIVFLSFSFACKKRSEDYSSVKADDRPWVANIKGMFKLKPNETHKWYFWLPKVYTDPKDMTKYCKDGWYVPMVRQMELMFDKGVFRNFDARVPGSPPIDYLYTFKPNDSFYKFGIKNRVAISVDPEDRFGNTELFVCIKPGRKIDSPSGGGDPSPSPRPRPRQRFSCGSCDYVHTQGQYAKGCYQVLDSNFEVVDRPCGSAGMGDSWLSLCEEKRDGYRGRGGDPRCRQN